MIIGGPDHGHILLFDAAKLLKGKNVETDRYLISDSKKHSEAVKALDIWGLSSPAAPVTMRTLSQPTDDVMCLAWNKHMQHILASSFSTRCVV